MNSEELEVSLRTEFENYLKSVLADMKQEISQLQETVSTEIERHKSQLDEVFATALTNFEKERELDAGFKESVIEHLRLSRDEGAQITAMAIAKAEELEKEKAAEEAAKEPVLPSVGVKEIHQAVNEISSKTTQSEILKTLVHHATEFAPRGSFFIVKNEHLVGWRVFGKEKGVAEEKVREVFLPISADSVLSEAVKSLTKVEDVNGGRPDDAELLEKLEFSVPDKMVAIPLVARGRGVAVLYADHGNEDGEVNAEALETLVRVAGLTVEVLASAKTASRKPSAKKAEAAFVEETSARELTEPQETYAPAVETTEFYATDETAQPVEEVPNEFSEAQETVETAEEVPTEFSATQEFETIDEVPTEFSAAQEIDETVEETPAEFSETTETVETIEESPSDFVSQPEVEHSFEDMSFNPPTVAEELPETTDFVEDDSQIEQTHFEEPAAEFESAETYAEFESAIPETQIEEPEQVESGAEFETVSTYETGFETVETSSQAEFETADTETQVEEEEETYPSFETSSWTSTTENTPGFSAQEFAQNFAKETDPSEYAKDFSYQSEPETIAEETKEYEFETSGSYQEVQTEPVVQTEEFVPTKEQTYGSFEIENGKVETAEVSQPISTPPVKSRLSERNVDLPIEVTEDERRLHNDARRFARLLVSEIKLYNEQKVKEGRDSSDLYDRLKEAIDRSREMYDKRVQPPVAAKFDYFHYELVNTLAEGDDNKLGAGYPGSAS